MPRGQASLTAVEAAIGVLLLLSVAFTFALGPATTDTHRTQLDIYATDTLAVLANEAPSHRGTTRLGELTESNSSFEREKPVVERRIQRILPANVMFRLETRHGTLGNRLPADVETGVATTTTRDGTVRLRVWYA